MDILEHYGTAVLQQHEGSRQLASALAGNVRALARRLTRLLAGPDHRTPTASSS